MRITSAAVDALLIALAVLDTVVNAGSDYVLMAVCAGAAVIALLLRRQHPYLALVLTLPLMLFSMAVIATLIALYSVAVYTKDRRALVACSVAVAIAYAFPWPPRELEFVPRSVWVIDVIYAVMFGATPAVLGLLVRARADLSARLSEISEAHERERELIAETVLSAERTRLAREMHDVVSHQVSLIAVQATALQVSTLDPDVERAGMTIRELSVQTLDELRHMVSLLRASGGVENALAPQPRLSDVERLIERSGIDAGLEMAADLPADIAPPVQRAVYRTVQEGLTNIRKHAPGTTVTVRIWQDGATIAVSVTNTRPTRVPTPLPSAHHGLVGLRERADLLGGRIDAGATPDGGYRLEIRLPAKGS